MSIPAAPSNDDSVHDRLVGTRLPNVRLESTAGAVDMVALAQDLLVLFVYPHATGLPEPPVPGWDSIPGAVGCTAQSCGFRDAHVRLSEFGATLAGVSVQEHAEQASFADRVGLRYPLISDPRLELAKAIGLPIFSASHRTFYRRLTLIVTRGRIAKVFYPIEEPARNATDVVEWLQAEGHLTAERSV